MKAIIVKHLKKMEFVCGLKQFKEYKEQDATELINCLNDLFKKFGWMTEERVDPKPPQQRPRTIPRGNCALE